MRKNVCVCRHFQNLNKGSLFRPDRASIFGTKARKKLYLDVWLVDFFSPSQTDVTDTTSLFILQLACIVNMVPRWKKLSIRVFAAARDCASQTTSEADTDLEGNSSVHHHHR
jgi:potassium/chloride transporter 9